jgi:hypothetical protein
LLGAGAGVHPFALWVPMSTGRSLLLTAGFGLAELALLGRRPVGFDRGGFVPFGLANRFLLVGFSAAPRLVFAVFDAFDAFDAFEPEFLLPPW